MPFSGNSTPHYNLGQYVGTDKSSWYDNNAQFQAVDSAIFTVEEIAQTANNAATVSQGTANQANQAAVSAGAKSDAVASQLASALTWVSGSFVNPNQNKFTGYGLSYKYNKDLGLLYIYGSITSAQPNYIVQSDVVCNFSTIPNFTLPNGSITIHNAGISLSGSGTLTSSALSLSCSSAGQVTVNSSNSILGNAYALQIGFTVCTNGWGTAQ